MDLKAQLDHSADVADVVTGLKAKLAAIPSVIAKPAPDVEILDYSLAGPVLAVRPYTHTDHYWQVYFEGNRVIREVGGEAALCSPLLVPKCCFVVAATVFAIAAGLAACGGSTPPAEEPAAAVAEKRAENAEDNTEANTDRAENAADKAEDNAAAADKSADKAEKAAEETKK